jgi:hypothetical protein
MPYISVNIANGSLVADLSGANLGVNGGAVGLADTYVQPISIGWHFGKRVDFNAGYSFTAPTARDTSGTTLYITKNQGTTANVVTDWEIHGQKTVASVPAGQTSQITPGQAFTDEWGIGQVHYSVHGIGVRANYILPANLSFFFNYYDEYSAKARVKGRTIVFGGSWTLRIPKAQPAKS